MSSAKQCPYCERNSKMTNQDMCEYCAMTTAHMRCLATTSAGYNEIRMALDDARQSILDEKCKAIERQLNRLGYDNKFFIKAVPFTNDNVFHVSDVGFVVCVSLHRERDPISAATKTSYEYDDESKITPTLYIYGLPKKAGDV